MTGWPPTVILDQPASVMLRLEQFWHAYAGEMSRMELRTLTPYMSR